jgi:hypothetical protein
VTARPVRIDPDAGLPDLVRRLSDDSRRLVRDEIRLAKLETREAIHAAARGGLWLGVAFGVGIVGLIAMTVALATGLGRLANDNMWAGAMAAGVIELLVGALLINRGVKRFSDPSYTLAETRSELKETVDWAAHARERV